MLMLLRDPVQSGSSTTPAGNKASWPPDTAERMPLVSLDYDKLVFCQYPDGSRVMLGQGSFGEVSLLQRIRRRACMSHAPAGCVAGLCMLRLPSLPCSSGLYRLCKSAHLVVYSCTFLPSLV